MSWVAVAVGGSALIGGVVGVTSANKAAKAQEKGYRTAAEASNEATQANIAFQQGVYDQTRADLLPYRTIGSGSLYELKQKILQGPGEFNPAEDPGYKFGYQEFIEKPTLRSAAATGNLGGGAVQKALTRYASDYGSTKYNNFLDRYYASLQPYANLASLGENAAAITGNAGANLASNVGGALTTNAAVQGGSAVGAGNALAGNYINNANTITGAVNSGLNNWISLRALQGNGLFGGGNSVTGGVTQYPPNRYGG